MKSLYLRRQTREMATAGEKTLLLAAMTKIFNWRQVYTLEDVVELTTKSMPDTRHIDRTTVEVNITRSESRIGGTIIGPLDFTSLLPGS